MGLPVFHLAHSLKPLHPFRAPAGVTGNISSLWIQILKRNGHLATREANISQKCCVSPMCCEDHILLVHLDSGASGALGAAVQYLQQ